MAIDELEAAVLNLNAGARAKLAERPLRRCTSSWPISGSRLKAAGVAWRNHIFARLQDSRSLGYSTNHGGASDVDGYPRSDTALGRSIDAG